jgi:hypothetical protein
MSRTLDRFTASDRLRALHDAEWYLKQARAQADRAQAPRTIARIRLALTSCQGAIRNAECRVTRARD